MIVSFRHKGLRRFFETGTTAGFQSSHAKRLRMQLAALHTAASVDDMDIPGFRLHRLKGRDKARWSIWVNGNWRLTFEFRDGNAYVLDYEDYH
ncbi:type II toxin-antitoxin system RelE/ParE family toxin [Halomonas sp. NO4]|uniref:type II toxin-antitoxin system RelE/ParE family toxin n=1 Tax=Halomonas sp. NO4 TaxID=2484813 RepID=UPI0013CF53B2|nr:type II toxin-antitoxin system RelE/ParE family toxin [Halomonas sp. NO4]